MVNKEIPQHWTRKYFKRNKVWMATDKSGATLMKENRVLVKYQLDQDHEYWVLKKHIRDISDQPETPPSESPTLTDRKPVSDKASDAVEESSPADPDTIVIHTDGASSGNPGPSGIGVVMRYHGHVKKISKYIGRATNNVAELEAVRTALVSLKRKDLPVRIHTDSQYVYGLFASGWRVRKNQQLEAMVRKLISQYKNIQFIKVCGHQGILDNELADRLATSAIHRSGTEK